MLALSHTPESVRDLCQARAEADSTSAGQVRGPFQSSWNGTRQNKHARLAAGEDGLMPWLTTMAPPLHATDNIGQRFIRAAKVTVLSALLNAPSLVPFLLYYGHADETSRWMERLGVKVIHTNLTFTSKLPAHQRSERQSNGNVFARRTARSTCPFSSPPRARRTPVALWSTPTLTWSS